MKMYLNKFELHEDYVDFMSDEDEYITPNVSVCVDKNEVHYNPFDPHEYVDLGLPSGALWATENIKDSDGNELYFAWGETEGYTDDQVTGSTTPHKNFNWSDYKYGTSINNLTKYNSTDGKTVLDSEDDAATVNWGKNWKMPTKALFEELIENTTSEWTTDGKTGITFTSNNGNTLFFPAVGSAGDGGVYDVGDWGFCLASSLFDGSVYNAWLLDFGSDECDIYRILPLLWSVCASCSSL